MNLIDESNSHNSESPWSNHGDLKRLGHNHQSGMSLSELLVSLFLTTCIVTFLIQFYISNKQMYIKTQQQLEEYMDIRWVKALMSRSIRQAGFTPCMGITQLQVVDTRNIQKPVLGISIQNNPYPSIHVNRMHDYFSQVKIVHSATELELTNSASFKTDHPVLIADCEHAEIHDISRINKHKNYLQITLTKPLVFSYAPSAYVGEWLEEQWIFKPSRTKINTLYYKLFKPEALTSLIHSVSITQESVDKRALIRIKMTRAENRSDSLVVAVRHS